MPARISLRLASSVSSRNGTSSLASSRTFTCTSCLAQQRNPQQQQRQRSAPFSTSSCSLAESQSQTDSLSHARELQDSTEPAELTRSPIPQRRLPRWSETPAAMRAPFSVRKNDPANRFAVNEDPAKLDRAWDAVFGEGGQNLVPDEAKWLAVTHKSFDQGRRGYNDRLAFVGKRLIDLQTSLGILAQQGLNAATASEGNAVAAQETGAGEVQKTMVMDDYGREVFDHPVMDILTKLTPISKREFTDSRRVAGLARDFGLHQVVRWKPKQAQDLVGSGQDTVLVQALYAMVGALAFHKGGDQAVKAVRTRILPRLGLKV